VRLEGLGKLKNPMMSSGIEPAIIRLVAQCLKLSPLAPPSRRYTIKVTIEVERGDLFVY
jgi:hypothetical protein